MKTYTIKHDNEVVLYYGIERAILEYFEVDTIEEAKEAGKYRGFEFILNND